MPYPHLTRAPITEGLVDLIVKPSPEMSHASLTAVRDALTDSYGTAKALRTVRAAVHVSSEKGSQSVETETIGYRLEASQGSFVVLIRRNGLTVSRLKPYTQWEDLIAEALKVWRLYVEVCKPEAITRVATRFINNLEFPGKGLDFDDYLVAMPRIPRGLPEVLVEFLVRLVVPDAASGAYIATTQSLHGYDVEADSVQVLLDIDVFKGVDLVPSSEEPWQLLDTMRGLKNTAFFGAITPKTLELLK